MINEGLLVEIIGGDYWLRVNFRIRTGETTVVTWTPGVLEDKTPLGPK